MRRLAIDTSSTACTVALRFDEQLIERHEVQPRAHTRLLLPMIRNVMAEASVEIYDLDSIVLGNGPGSFIGMRIAASVAQGLAHGASIGIRPVSSLAAVAAEVMAEEDAATVAVAQDAHMNEVYLGVFGRDDQGLPGAIASERLYSGGVIEELADTAKPACVAAGSGWGRYPNLAAASGEKIARFSRIHYPRAKFLLEISATQSTMRPNEVEPAYIRHKVAAKPGQK